MDEDAVALRLGRLVIASARLELQVKTLTEFLGEPNVGALSQFRQFKAIRRRVVGRPDCDEIRAWATESNGLLKARGELVHGGFLGRWKENRMTLAYISYRAGEVVDVDLARLDGLVDVAKRLSDQGRKYAATVFGEFIHLIDGEYNRE